MRSWTRGDGSGVGMLADGGRREAGHELHTGDGADSEIEVKLVPLRGVGAQGGGDRTLPATSVIPTGQK